MIALTWLGAPIPCQTDACRAIASQLPPCYGAEFAACADEMDAHPNEANPIVSSGCQQYVTLRQQLVAQYGKSDYNAAIDAMPFCPQVSIAKEATTTALKIGIGFALGLALGVVLGISV